MPATRRRRPQVAEGALTLEGELNAILALASDDDEERWSPTEGVPSSAFEVAEVRSGSKTGGATQRTSAPNCTAFVPAHRGNSRAALPGVDTNHAAARFMARTGIRLRENP